MRPIEIAVWLVAFPLLLWSLTHRTLPWWGRLIPAVALVLMVAQILVESPRCHFGPVYLVSIYLFIVCTWPRLPNLEPGPWSAAAGIGLLVVAAALAIVFPVFHLPDPTGPYPIGTVTLHLVDAARQDPHTHRADGRREV